MNYDELLADINEAIQYEEDKQVWKALRAVVELHKPTKNRSIEGWCDVCTDYYQYPCPTIQAIEGVLK